MMPSGAALQGIRSGNAGQSAEGRALLLMRGDKKGHRAVHVADPDLDGAGVKIESALLVEIGEIDYSVTGARSRRERIASRRSSFATGLVR
jgi:hypothetical protein